MLNLLIFVTCVPTYDNASFRFSVVNVDGRPLARPLTPAVYAKEELGQLGIDFQVIYMVETSICTWTWKCLRLCRCCTRLSPCGSFHVCCVCVHSQSTRDHSSVLVKGVVGLCTLFIFVYLPAFLAVGRTERHLLCRVHVAHVLPAFQWPACYPRKVCLPQVGSVRKVEALLYMMFDGSRIVTTCLRRYSVDVDGASRGQKCCRETPLQVAIQSLGYEMIRLSLLHFQFNLLCWV